MQQQTRQRTTRERKNTPLPEKRGRTRQTTRSRHANTTHRHMVNQPPPFQQEERRGTKKDEERRGGKRTQQRDAMVFGDNVRARKAARALPRTPTQKEKKKKKKKGKKEEETEKTKKTNDKTTHPSHPAIPQPITQYDKTRQDKTCTVVTTWMVHRQ